MKLKHVSFACCILLLMPIFSEETEEALGKKYNIEIRVQPEFVGPDNKQPLFSFDRIPDSSLIRKVIAKTWFFAAPQDVLSLSEKTYTDINGNTFTVKAQALPEKKQIAVMVIPEINEYSATGKNMLPQGTWILYRNDASGEPVQIKILPRENPNLYILLHPAKAVEQKGKSFIDICLYNAYVRKDMPLGVSFNDLLYFSLINIRSISKDVLPWELFNPPGSYSAIESMTKIIKQKSYGLVPLPNGCFDESGRPVHISDGTPQKDVEIIRNLRIDQIPKEVIGGVDTLGFAKWVIDGIIYPVAGQGIYVSSLKKATSIPDTHFNKADQKDRKAFLSIDWIRNLASAAFSLDVKRTVYPDKSGVDVKIEPFALTFSVPMNDKSSPPFVGYLKDTGYQIEYLHALLYYLAATEPGHFYLGVINEEKTAPKMRHYKQVLVFFPYFDTYGHFRIETFQQISEFRIEDVIKDNQKDYISLVRVRAPEIGLFNP
ncbi:hypothetical protein [Treponema phagedenis]|uniref:hypothetical protein n=1 Tax=Treponema phagedenis TaxID=162 RepID=UPI0011E76B8B|nr:hypothetical protein [Treponema phagedenis]QEK01248.1 hypothetical protein FUT84_08865 [Treponema phagedenis]QEK06267.1 hypothetical protein FUT80_05790 [Treponema phagedenis]